MTGRQVLQQAMLLLGYTDENGQVDLQKNTDLLRKGTAVTEQVFADLCLCESGLLPQAPFRLDEELPLKAVTVRDVMPFGVAMLLAQAEGDGENQSVFAGIYNQKRARCGGKTSRIDVLPR